MQLNSWTHVLISCKQCKVWPITWRRFTDRIVAVAGPISLSNTIKLGRTGSCDEMIRGRVRTLHKLNSPLSSRVWKSISCPKCMPFVFGGDGWRCFSRKNKQNSNFECLHFVHCRPILAMQQLVALHALRNVLTQRKVLRCVRCVVKETAPKSTKCKSIQFLHITAALQQSLYVLQFHSGYYFFYSKNELIDTWLWS